MNYNKISEKNKCIFIDIAKTGGLKIERSFLFEDIRKALGGRHVGGHKPIKSFDQSLFQDYFKFGVVRHPCSRLISVWKHLNKEKFSSRKWQIENMNKETRSNFNAFVESLFPGGHVRIEKEEQLKSQVGMLFGGDKTFGLDQLLVYEIWNKSMDILGNRTQLNMSSLKVDFAELDGNEDCAMTFKSSSWEKLTNVFAMDFCVLGYSRYIDRLHVLPSLSWTPQTLTERYANCKKKVLRDASTIKSSATNVNVTMNFGRYDKCTVYTYFQSLSSKTDAKKKEMDATLEIWKNAWSSFGWTARIISEDDAKKHPSYHQLRERYATYPTRGNPEYEIACFLRYLAMAAVGGGWMTDFDVLPINLPACTEPCHNGSFTIYERHVPAIVSGNESEYTRVATLMGNIDWESITSLNVEGGPHVSDMLCLAHFVRVGSVISEWLVYEVVRVFRFPFYCNKTMIEPSKPICLQSQIPSPTLPVAIHFSHSGVSKIKQSPDLSRQLWGNLSSYRQISRVSAMSDIYDLICKECHIEYT